MKNFAYEVVCRRDHGWGLEPSGLWGYDYVERADRIFATAAEARAVCADLRDAGCWYIDDDDGRHLLIPEFAVERIAVYEACWLDPDNDRAVIDRLTAIHGAPIVFAQMPGHVARFLAARYEDARTAWQSASAAMAGASSATHTAALLAGLAQVRIADIAAVRNRTRA